MDAPDIPEKSDRLHDQIAVSVAILAAFMAVTKVKDDNIVQAMLQAKSDAVDTWGEYQAKKIKQHLVELGRDQAHLLRLTAPPAAAAEIDAVVKRDEAEIVRYQREEGELRTKAKQHEADYDALNYRDDQFDLSDAALSVSLAVLAVAALTSKRWLLVLSYAFGAFGMVMGLAGLLGWHLHPDAITRLLS
jgi:hypothetical protein